MVRRGCALALLTLLQQPPLGAGVRPRLLRPWYSQWSIPYNSFPLSYPQTGTAKVEMAWAESDRPAIADSVNWHADVSQ